MIGDPKDNFRRSPPEGDEWAEYWQMRHEWERSGWIVTIMADMASSARRLGIIAGTCAAIGAAVAWSVKQGWWS